MTGKYENRNAAGECFVHIRKKHPSKKDLKALSRLTRGNKFYKVNLRSHDAESVLTNSARLAKVIETSHAATVKM